MGDGRGEGGEIGEVVVGEEGAEGVGGGGGGGGEMEEGGGGGGEEVGECFEL